MQQFLEEKLPISSVISSPSLKSIPRALCRSRQCRRLLISLLSLAKPSARNTAFSSENQSWSARFLLKSQVCVAALPCPIFTLAGTVGPFLRLGNTTHMNFFFILKLSKQSRKIGINFAVSCPFTVRKSKNSAILFFFSPFFRSDDSSVMYFSDRRGLGVLKSVRRSLMRVILLKKSIFFYRYEY